MSRRYYREGFYDQAFALISDALSIMPKNKALRMQKTYAYIQLNLADHCLQTVQEVLQEIDTVYLKADFLSTLGECYLLDGQLINARMAFQQSIELDSTRNIRAIRGLSGT
jgi:tetratricopeptide (TPR) repeat protein